MPLELKEIFKIRKEANCRERTNINGKPINGFFARYGYNVLFVILSAGLVLNLKNGFSAAFVQFGSSVLAILVGLFITALVFSLDKFYRPLAEKEPNSRAWLWDLQGYNYTKKFAFVTGYTIVLCLLTIVLLSLSALFEKETQLDVFKLGRCTECISFWQPGAIILFLQASFLILQRFLVLYWMLRILSNTVFVVVSMVDYMVAKMGRTNDSN